MRRRGGKLPEDVCAVWRAQDRTRSPAEAWNRADTGRARKARAARPAATRSMPLTLSAAGCSTRCRR